MCPSSTYITPSSRPAATGSAAATYLRTELVGFTEIERTLLNLVIRASASPTPRYSSVESLVLNVWNGRTASDNESCIAGTGACGPGIISAVGLGDRHSRKRSENS